MPKEKNIRRLKKCIADTIGVKEKEIKLASSLIDDLGADSLDLLDLVFRIEQTFKIRISRGEIEQKAKQTLPDGEFEKAGFLTAKAKKALQKSLPEVGSQKFKGKLRKTDIPRLFTVQTFLRLIEEKMEKKNAAKK